MQPHRSVAVDDTPVSTGTGGAISAAARIPRVRHSCGVGALGAMAVWHGSRCRHPYYLHGPTAGGGSDPESDLSRLFRSHRDNRATNARTPTGSESSNRLRASSLYVTRKHWLSARVDTQIQYGRLLT